MNGAYVVGETLDFALLNAGSGPGNAWYDHGV